MTFLFFSILKFSFMSDLKDQF